MKYITFFICVMLSTSLFGQYEYEVSAEFPYGKPNPEASERLLDYSALIGQCNCMSSTRAQDGTWMEKEPMMWRFKYIMNGTAIQDETLKLGGGHSGSIRQFVQDSSKWYVHYYSNVKPSTSLSVFTGGMEGENIVLRKPQQAPNGMDGYFRLTFSEISSKGFNWIGEWVDLNEKIQFPTWKIWCTKE